MCVVCTFYHFLFLQFVVTYFLDPPSINNVTASTSRTPSDLSGFDIFIMWTVSGLYTYVRMYISTYGTAQL